MVRLKTLAFLHGPSSQPTSDPEKGRQSDHPAEERQNDHDDERRSDEDEDDSIDIDDEHDSDIQEVEREEYPEVETTRRPGRSNRFPRTLSVVSVSRSWSRLKDFVNTDTSHEDLDSYVPHYRYLPIVSGIIIPFCILLEIPGLTADWYIHTVNNVVQTKPNTVILDVGLAFSLFCGVVANICLFVRFLEKRIMLMTVLCVVFLTIHDIINITATTIFGVTSPPNEGFTYGQAFWMVVCSTSVSSFVNVTLIIDLVRTKDFCTSGSGLTRKQRSLVLSVMILLCYIAFGAVVQFFLINDLTFLNALYFTVVSIETIGFGDIVPTSTGGRVFTCLFSVFGILSLAVTVTLTRETVLEALEVEYRKRVRTVRLRRKEANRRKRIASRWYAAIKYRLRESGLPVWVRDDPAVHHHRGFMQMFHNLWPWSARNHSFYTHPVYSPDNKQRHGTHLNLDALSCAQLEAAALETGVPLSHLLPTGFKMPVPRPQDDAIMAQIEKAKSRRGWGTDSRSAPSHPVDLPLTHVRVGRMAVMLGSFALAFTEHSFASPEVRTAQFPQSPTLTEDSTVGINSPHPSSIAEQYESLRESIAIEEKRAFAARLTVVWIFFIGFWTVGSGIFSATEGWPFGTAMYFCFIAFTTIGYGDLTPKTPAGRAVFIVWALLGVGTVTILLSILSEAYSYRYKRSLHSSIFLNAVKRYRRDVLLKSERSRAKRAQPMSPTQASLDGAFSGAQKHVGEQLEALPHEVLRQAQAFNENVQYLLKQNVLGGMDETVPGGLKKLLDDIAGTATISERLKREVLQDRDTRRTLLSITVADGLRQIIDLAEDALRSVQERDRISACLSQQDAPPADDVPRPHSPHVHETTGTAAHEQA